MTGWDAFNKYIGVQGVLAVMLIAGYIAAIFVHVVLPDAYSQITTLILGYYFAKNGTGAISQMIAAIKTKPLTASKGK